METLQDTWIRRMKQSLKEVWRKRNSVSRKEWREVGDFFLYQIRLFMGCRDQEEENHLLEGVLGVKR